jgi:DNA polymerase III alpha subunit (gram-positive type)
VPSNPAVYIVTDIEADGGTPGIHSMIAFAAVAVSENGDFLGEFEAVLQPLEGGTQDPNTMKFWASQPEAWAAATHDPLPPEAVMQSFVAWVKQYPHAIFAAHPINFDAMWMNFYLRRYTRYAVTQGLHETDRLFGPYGLCLRSFAAALLGKSVEESGAMDGPSRPHPSRH